jgi:glycosyltransferase involved in cell wall biosynthesis
MNIIWHIASPTMKGGYGTCAREIAPRIRDSGHNVVIASRIDNESSTWKGMPVITGRDNIALSSFIESSGNIDYVISAQDPWDEPKQFKNWVALAALDIEYGYPEIARKLAGARFQFCVSQHNLQEFRKLGLNPFYCPWGVDTKQFVKQPGAREKFNELHGIPENTFLVGTVGQNIFSDRKNFVGLLRAFAYFCQKHSNAMLYIHSSRTPSYSLFSDFLRSSGGIGPWLEKLSNSFGLAGKVIYPEKIKFMLNNFTDGDMSEIYNAFDVFCLPTRGESFCLPLLEVQACEVPAIVTDTTACPEMVQRENGWLIPIEEDDYMYTDTGSFAANPRPKMIAEQLEYAYEAWENGKLQEMGKKARESVLHFDWDLVFKNHWEPFLSFLGGNK